MERRKPGKNKLVTSRKEEDKVTIKSGIDKNNILNGQKMKFIIKNNNVNSKAYNSLLRPGHADWTSLIKYKKVLPGGGQFSGRLTAPIVFIGSIIENYLKEKYKITISSKISSLYKTSNPSEKQISKIIEELKNEGDSAGGVLEINIKNMVPGLGSDFFGGVESVMSKYLFSIPGVKGVSFGDGFGLSQMKGSQANDELFLDANKKIYTKTNHMGGILGGITSGMDLKINVGFKPTPSISKEQHTVDYKTFKEAIISTNGRHDPTIILRGQVVCEAYIAIALFELINEKK
jgi:chorismate synthase